MTAMIVSNVPPFGALTNKTVAELFEINQNITRLKAAVAAAASGYPGTAGTAFEGNGTNFGVLPSATAGAKGADYAAAVNALAGAWVTFWNAALLSIQALDNGTSG